jgi:hypothetical protein
MSGSQTHRCRLRSRLCHSSCESSVPRLEALSTGNVITVRFSELAGGILRERNSRWQGVMLVSAQIAPRIDSGVQGLFRRRLSRAMSSVLDPVEVTMKEDSDDCILQRKVFSTLVTGAQPIPLLREDLIPQAYAQLLRSISMKCGIFLGIINEVNAALRNNYFATTEEPRIK